MEENSGSERDRKEPRGPVFPISPGFAVQIHSRGQTGKTEETRLLVFAVALLVLLSTSAPARIVATQLSPACGRVERRRAQRLPAHAGHPGRLARPRTVRCGARRARGTRPGNRRHRARRQLRAGLYLEPEEYLHRLLLNFDQHLLEQIVSLALILDQRTDLGIRAQANPFPQRLHRVEVVDPLPVDGLQEYQPFHLTQLLCADFLLLALVGPQRCGDERLLEIIAAGPVRKWGIRQCRDPPRP